MKHPSSILVLVGLSLLAGATFHGSMKFGTRDAVILDDDAGYMELLPEGEFRQETSKHAGEAGGTGKMSGSLSRSTE